MDVTKTNRQGDQPVAPTGPKPKSIGSLIAGYKSTTTKQINLLNNSPGNPVWHRNYYEHIIRNDTSYEKISEYIMNNPLNWQKDEYNRK